MAEERPNYICPRKTGPEVGVDLRRGAYRYPENAALVSAIIINWNGKELIENCVDSLLAQTYPNLEIVIVDNGSDDGSLEFIKQTYPQVKLIEYQSNKGFCHAINHGIRESSGTYILSLNNDVILQPSFLNELVGVISVDDTTGSATGKLLKAAPKNGEVEIDSVGHVIFNNRLAFDLGDGEIDNGEHNTAGYVFGACAAAGLYRRDMLEDVEINGEYFDEAFFAFLDDVDLSWRAQLRGWKCMFTPKATAHHYRGKTAGRGSKLVELNNYKNRYLMILKNDSLPAVVKNFHHFLLTDSCKTGALLFRCPEALQGWFDVVKEVPRTIAKRRLIQKNRKVSQSEIESFFPDFDYSKWFKRHFFRSNW